MRRWENWELWEGEEGFSTCTDIKEVGCVSPKVQNQDGVVELVRLSLNVGGGHDGDFLWATRGFGRGKAGFTVYVLTRVDEQDLKTALVKSPRERERETSHSNANFFFSHLGDLGGSRRRAGWPIEGRHGRRGTREKSSSPLEQHEKRL